MLCGWLQELDGAKYGQAPRGPASKQGCLHAVPLAELSSAARWVCPERVAIPERAGGVDPRLYCKGGRRALLERFESWSPLPENCLATPAPSVPSSSPTYGEGSVLEVLAKWVM